MSLGLGPGVSIFIPDVLMGSTRKLPSHGILTEVWNVRAICLAPLPAPLSVRGPHTHSCPRPFGVDGGYVRKRHTVSSAGGREATTLCFLATCWAWFVLASLREGECGHACRWVCCACVCTPLPSYPRNNTSWLH